MACRTHQRHSLRTAERRGDDIPPSLLSHGARTGGLLYCNDPDMTDEVEEAIVSKLEQSKGIGNFSTIFVNIPKGDPDGIKFIPIGDISARASAPRTCSPRIASRQGWRELSRRTAQ